MIYVHVPFCKSFCTYCDFYSEIARRQEDYVAYADEICAEAQRRRSEIEATLDVATLYIGGGTPSVLPLDVLYRIVRALPYGPYKEFTVEVNPEDIVDKGIDYALGLKELGINRISMGVQSLDDEMLRWMNRRHDSARAKKAFELLRKAGFDNISVDLIFGISHLKDDVLDSTLKEIVSWKPEHVSAYQLSIEEGSALCKLVNEGRYEEASQEKCSGQYYHICDVLRGAGYHHYEISNWALPGREAVHNSAYWTRAPYAGLGPGAHSLRGRDVRSWNSDDLSGWTPEEEHLSEDEIREETLMLGLRTDKGIDGKVIPESQWFVSDSIIAGLL